jgi:CRISPR-associated protein Csb2
MPTNPDPTEIPNSIEPGSRTKDREKRRKELADGVRNLLPVHRKKAGLPIPAVIPDDPAVYFIWPDAAPDDSTWSILQAICERVGYLGRSRSLIRASLVDDPPRPTHVPDRLGHVQVRVPGPDRICYLIGKYQRDGGKPEPSPPIRYRAITDGDHHSRVLHSAFDRMFVFKPDRGDPSLPAESTLKVTKALRQELIRCVHEQVCGCSGWNDAEPTCSEAIECFEKIPTLVSGYDVADGQCTPTTRPHLGFLALPFVDERQRHADGSIKGVAVAIPRHPKDSELQALASGLVSLLKRGLAIPGVGQWRLTEVPADNPPLRTLELSQWTRPARTWSTVTPMVFDRLPKEKNGGEPAVILESLRRVGIDPEAVVEIAVGRHAPWHGAPPSWQFKPQTEHPSVRQGGWMLRHVTLRFDRDVRGPILLGRLRYFGLGLMRPMEQQ